MFCSKIQLSKKIVKKNELKRKKSTGLKTHLYTNVLSTVSPLK